MSDALGSSKIRQESIGEKVNIDQICKLYISILDEFEKVVNKTNDTYANNLLNQLRNKGKFDIPINKHIGITSVIPTLVFVPYLVEGKTIYLMSLPSELRT